MLALWKKLKYHMFMLDLSSRLIDLDGWPCIFACLFVWLIDWLIDCMFFVFCSLDMVWQTRLHWFEVFLQKSIRNRRKFTASVRGFWAKLCQWSVKSTRYPITLPAVSSWTIPLSQADNWAASAFEMSTIYCKGGWCSSLAIPVRALKIRICFANCKL